MATRVQMPKQGLQMTEGNIIQWFYAEGDSVEEDKPLFEMETDKLTIEIDAPASGTLLKIVRPAGDVVPITELIAVIGEPGEDISDILAASEGTSDGTAGSTGAGSAKTDAAGDAGAGGAVSDSGTTGADGMGSSGASGSTEGARGSAAAPATASVSSSVSSKSSAATSSATDGQAPGQADNQPPGGRLFITPRARMRAEELGVDVASLAGQGSGGDGLVIERDVLDAAARAPQVTPVARKTAEISGVSLEDVAGSGPRGRILKRDVEAAASRREEERPVPSRSGETVSRTIPLTGMRRTIARRMRESLDTAAQAVHRIEVDMSESVRLRERLKQVDIRVSYNDIILKATAAALREYPRMNSTFTGEEIIEWDQVNIGVAVALVDGLVVPVLRDADQLGLQEIHEQAAALGERARTGRLSGEELSGGTFSVSNLGMYDIDSFTAIIDTPQTGILAVGAIKERMVVENGEGVIRPICRLSLTYDHRVVDGAPAAVFLQTVKQILENPYVLI